MHLILLKMGLSLVSQVIYNVSSKLCIRHNLICNSKDGFFLYSMRKIIIVLRHANKISFFTIPIQILRLHRYSAGCKIMKWL